MIKVAQLRTTSIPYGEKKEQIKKIHYFEGHVIAFLSWLVGVGLIGCTLSILNQ